jgi:probable aminopeptidase NPEPL1
LFPARCQEVAKVGAALGKQCRVIRGDELLELGLGGIHGVGRAATTPPALAVLSHLVPGAKRTVAWVGKGIVYDTGGLSIKGKVTCNCHEQMLFRIPNLRAVTQRAYLRCIW